MRQPASGVDGRRSVVGMWTTWTSGWRGYLLGASVVLVTVFLVLALAPVTFTDFPF